MFSASAALIEIHRTAGLAERRCLERTMTTTQVAATEPYVATEELAAYLGKPTSWLWNNVLKLGIPHVRVGRGYRFKVSEVDAWLRDQAA